MIIGAASFTLAVGAVRAFAVTAEVTGIDLQVVGYILPSEKAAVDALRADRKKGT